MDLKVELVDVVDLKVELGDVEVVLGVELGDLEVELGDRSELLTSTWYN